MLCLHIPEFLLAVHRRQAPELGDRALVVTEGSGRDRVLQASREAREAGVRPGMTRVQALAACPGAAAVDAAPPLYEQRREALLHRLSGLAPRIEAPAGWDPLLVYADTRGLGRIHGRLETLLERVVAAADGFQGRAGAARTKLVARLAALHGPGILIVGASREREFLSLLPVTVLEPDDSLRERFFLLGIQTLGDLLKLEVGDIADRYGPEGVRLHRLAAGEDPDPFRPWQPVPEWTETIAVDGPIDRAERLLFLLTQPLESLLTRLAAEGLACSELSFQFGLDTSGSPSDSSKSVRRLALGTVKAAPPAALARTFLGLLALDLERCGLGGFVDRVRLTASAVAPPHAEQGRLFGAPPVALASIAEAVARLAARLGPDAVFSPELVASWRPEAAYWRTPCRLAAGEKEQARASQGSPRKSRAQPGGNAKQRRAKTASPCMDPLSADRPAAGCPEGLRLLPVPERAAVEEQAGRPVRLAWSDIRGVVSLALGPWSLSGEWWSGGFARDYHEVELTGGCRLWIFRDTASSEWFVHGVFD